MEESSTPPAAKKQSLTHLHPTGALIGMNVYVCVQSAELCLCAHSVYVCDVFPLFNHSFLLASDYMWVFRVSHHHHALDSYSLALFYFDFLAPKRNKTLLEL